MFVHAQAYAWKGKYPEIDSEVNKVNWFKAHLYLTIGLAWVFFAIISAIILEIVLYLPNEWIYILLAWVILGTLALFLVCFWAIKQKGWKWWWQ
jgi:hypothetical protein